MTVFPQTWLSIIILLKLSTLFTLKNLFTLLPYFPAGRIEHQAEYKVALLGESEISAQYLGKKSHSVTDNPEPIHNG